MQDMKLIFFSDGNLAPKFFKVVANSKKVGCHFQRQTKPLFTLSAFQIDPLKLSQGKDISRATKWKLGWMIYNLQAHLNPIWYLLIDREACAAFWKQT